jgi:hypothetical protein
VTMLCALAIGPLLLPLFVPCAPPPPAGWHEPPPPRYEQRRRPPPVEDDLMEEGPAGDILTPMPRPRERSSTLAPVIGERYDFPNGIKVTFEPEDMWAYANLGFPEIPPVQYDHAYAGRTTVYYADKEIWETCNIPRTKFPGSGLVGCARLNGSECTIIIAPESIFKKWGLTYRLIVRHEIGHCNGWAQDHAGAR